MRGKVFFKTGDMHRSRGTATSTITFQRYLAQNIRKSIQHHDFVEAVRRLVWAVGCARQEHLKSRSRKDALAQLQAMLRLKGDDELLHALRGCDRMTYEAIQQAQIDTISDVLFRDGVFIDIDGAECRIAPSMELGVGSGGNERVLPYLPQGFEGVRNAIAAALKNIEADGGRNEVDPGLHPVTLRIRIYPKAGAGNVEKTYQLDLACECLAVWKAYVNKDPKIHFSPRANKGSVIVEFANAVFTDAGMLLSRSRICAILKKGLIRVTRP